MSMLSVILYPVSASLETLSSHISLYISMAYLQNKSIMIATTEKVRDLNTQNLSLISDRFIWKNDVVGLMIFSGQQFWKSAEFSSSISNTAIYLSKCLSIRVNVKKIAVAMLSIKPIATNRVLQIRGSYYCCITNQSLSIYSQ